MDEEMNTFKSKSGKTITPEFFECDKVYNYPIYDGKRMIGRALLIAPFEITDGLVLLDIYIYEEEDRRKGAAEELLNLIKAFHPKIRTSHLSNAGLQLCLKNGFKLKKQKGQPDLLYYIQEE